MEVTGAPKLKEEGSKSNDIVGGGFWGGSGVGGVGEEG